MYDSVRGTGTGASLVSNSTSAEGADAIYANLTAFTSSGFTVGTVSSTNILNSVGTYVAWQWKANGAAVSNTNGTITSQVNAGTTQGFSVVTWTGTASGATVGHGLGVAPKMIIIKNRSSSTNWPVWHTSYGGSSNTDYQYLNDSIAKGGGGAANNWNGTAPTSSVISVGDTAGSNGSGSLMVAYCFAEVAGYSAFGKYTGNGSTDGPFVYCGFRPRFILTKNTTTGGYWWEMVDSSREPINPSDQTLYANVADAEYTSSTYNKDLLSNGFKMRGTSAGQNASGDVYIYACFAENPFKYSNAR